jgi:hypothetical protein
LHSPWQQGLFSIPHSTHVFAALHARAGVSVSEHAPLQHISVMLPQLSHMLLPALQSIGSMGSVVTQSCVLVQQS